MRLLLCGVSIALMLCGCSSTPRSFCAEAAGDACTGKDTTGEHCGCAAKDCTTPCSTCCGVGKIPCPIYDPTSKAREEER